jgi:curved DNA-binding protein CbpA
MTYYQLLKVSVTASPDEIKKAFRKLSKLYHPDVGGDTEQFKKINEAHQTLSDADKRRAYDRQERKFKFRRPTWEPTQEEREIKTTAIKITKEIKERGFVYIELKDIGYDALVLLAQLEDGHTYLVTGKTGLKGRIYVQYEKEEEKNTDLWDKVFDLKPPKPE